jgi:flagellin-like hook-associated protein FlgL
MQHIINDMASHYVNLAEARSRILDADMAKEITDLILPDMLIDGI